MLLQQHPMPYKFYHPIFMHLQALLQTSVLQQKARLLEKAGGKGWKSASGASDGGELHVLVSK